MTYSRLQTVSMSKTRFIIKDYKECPDNLNITLITRPVDDIPPKQEYDPSNSSVDVGYTHFKTHDEWFHTYNPHRMITISKLHASYITNFVSNYEENKRVAMEEARQLKRRKLSRIWKQNFVFGYTKIDLGYITNYSCSTSLY
ncbi:hypothetical protein CLU79DRAFT_727019 [Phycomyces nitens]|nr:hypothetical protein CLU79DRAFT_727019 [Phycomyces nitens]